MPGLLAVLGFRCRGARVSRLLPHGSPRYREEVCSELHS
jgi:hypothetical protein